jgi:hypothetical protein
MDINGRANHIQDYLVTVRSGQWFGWAKGDEPRMVYANLIVLDGGSKPTEQECTDGLAQMQTDHDDAETKQATDKDNANQKLKDLGLTDDEIKAIKGIN